MKIRPNVKYLVKKYKDEIAIWRADGPLVASWEQICRELCAREKLTGAEQPTGDGLRKAWKKAWKSGAARTSQSMETFQKSETSQTTQTIQTNRLAARVVEPFVPLQNEPANQAAQNSQKSETTQTVQTNRPENRANPSIRVCPTDEEWEAWPDDDKIRFGRPATAPDGRRYLSPLAPFEISQVKTQARYRLADEGKL